MPTFRDQAASNCREQGRPQIIRHIGLINFSLNTPARQFVMVRFLSCRKLSEANGNLSRLSFSRLYFILLLHSWVLPDIPDGPGSSDFGISSVF